MSEEIKLIGFVNIEQQLEGELNAEVQFTGGLNNVNSLYSGLIDKPQINGITLEGNKTSGQLQINEDKNFLYTQSVASDTWNIQHNLNKFPAVMVTDSSNNVVVGDINYIDINNIVITFSGAFSGKAYLN